ncbi:membrane-associated kinase regulator [Parasponia andersonii]|uniref:Membrane-associated kinase regulator n=1 Tax=Parasponia andersonii TaxID=3476 RepID=A0A2P5B1Z2_PARAD|nr:membrane-associated kinase regulator [Parasponia andersonii]
MAIELCSEKSPGMGVSNSSTPRISFSYDFLQSDVVPIEQRPLRSNSSGLNSSVDFDFCVRESFGEDSSSADELFSGGKILPTEIKKKITPAAIPKHEIPDQTTPQVDQALSQAPGARDESNKSSKKESNEGEERQSSKSFWRFKRSSSCGTGYGRTLCPLPLLSRSNSTGSADESKPINIKRPPLMSKEGSSVTKQNSQKSFNASTKLQSSQSHNSGASCSYQKPPLKKGHGAYGNGVSINPVLNVPPANLFAIGSIFTNGKNKTKKK